MHSKEKIFKWVVDILVHEFGFSPQDLRLDTHLIDDLDMDSIDAIDMAVRIEEKTNLSLNEEDLRSILTIQNAVDLINERRP
ncbi:MAG: acyl carrier protein [Myxococcota bacterium]